MSEWLNGTSCGLPNLLWVAAIVFVVIYVIVISRPKCHRDGLEVPKHHKRPHHKPSLRTSVSSVSNINVAWEYSTNPDIWVAPAYYLSFTGDPTLKYTVTLSSPSGTVLWSGPADYEQNNWYQTNFGAYYAPPDSSCVVPFQQLGVTITSAAGPVTQTVPVQNVMSGVCY